MNIIRRKNDLVVRWLVVTQSLKLLSNADRGETKRLPKRSQNNVEQNRTEPTTIGINSTAPMIEGALTHVTLVALPNGLRAPTNSLVHRTLADNAREDISRFITARYQWTSPDQSQTCPNPPLTSRQFAAASTEQLHVDKGNSQCFIKSRKYRVISNRAVSSQCFTLRKNCK